jgi:hypothetical protein
MADEKTQKPAVAGVQRRARLNTSNMKSAYCNYFSARFNPEEVLLDFGFDELHKSAPKDAQQVQILYRVILSVATTRRIKDALVELFQNRDAPGVRLKARAVPQKKPN